MFSHAREQGNFIVFLHCAGGADLAVNEIGTAEGSALAHFTDHLCLWEVQADGAWSLRPE